MRLLIPLTLAACSVSSPTELQVGHDALPADPEEVAAEATPGTQVSPTGTTMDPAPNTLAPAEDSLRFWGSFAGNDLGRMVMSSQRGLAFSGMSHNVCGIDTSHGSLGEEYSCDPSEPEEVTDGGDSEILSITGNGWYLLDPTTHEVLQGGRADVQDARLDGGQVVALYEAPNGCRVELGQHESAPLAGACPDHDGWAVDHGLHQAWLSIQGVLHVVSGEGVRDTGIHADRVTVDGALGVVATALQGSDHLSLWSVDGTHLRDVRFPGQVRQVQAMPERGLIAVLGADRNGVGSVITLVDEETGAWSWGLRTDQELRWLTVSQNGREFSLKVGDGYQAQTHFFYDTSR